MNFRAEATEDGNIFLTHLLPGQLLLTMHDHHTLRSVPVDGGAESSPLAKAISEAPRFKFFGVRVLAEVLPRMPRHGWRPQVRF
jgi:hypothetical protein